MISIGYMFELDYAQKLLLKTGIGSALGSIAGAYAGSNIDHSYALPGSLVGMALGSGAGLLSSIRSLKKKKNKEI